MNDETPQTVTLRQFIALIVALPIGLYCFALLAYAIS